MQRCHRQRPNKVGNFLLRWKREREKRKKETERPCPCPLSACRLGLKSGSCQGERGRVDKEYWMRIIERQQVTARQTRLYNLEFLESATMSAANQVKSPCFQLLTHSSPPWHPPSSYIHHSAVGLLFIFEFVGSSNLTKSKLELNIIKWASYLNLV